MSTVKSQSAPSAGRHVGMPGIILAVLVTAPVVFLAFRFLETVAQFDALFTGLGANLPGLTRFTVAHPLLIAIIYWLCAVSEVVFLILLMVNRTYAARRAFWRFAMITLGATLAIIVALYLPVFRLGSIV